MAELKRNTDLSTTEVEIPQRYTKDGIKEADVNNNVVVKEGVPYNPKKYKIVQSMQRFYGKNGMQDINLNLSDCTGKYFEFEYLCENNLIKSAFNDNAGDHPLASFVIKSDDIDDERWINYKPYDCNDVDGSVNSNVIKYTDVYTDTDIEYKNLINNIKQFITLKSNSAPTTFDFTIKACSGIEFKVGTLPILTIQYTGGSEAGTIEVTAGNHLLGKTQSTTAFDLDLTNASYDTLQEVVDYIDGLSTWSASIIAGSGTCRSKTLEVLAETDCKTAAKTLDAALKNITAVNPDMPNSRNFWQIKRPFAVSDRVGSENSLGFIELIPAAEHANGTYDVVRITTDASWVSDEFTAGATEIVIDPTTYRIIKDYGNITFCGDFASGNQHGTNGFMNGYGLIDRGTEVVQSGGTRCDKDNSVSNLTFVDRDGAELVGAASTRGEWTYSDPYWYTNLTGAKIKYTSPVSTTEVWARFYIGTDRGIVKATVDGVVNYIDLYNGSNTTDRKILLATGLTAGAIDIEIEVFQTRNISSTDNYTYFYGFETYTSGNELASKDAITINSRATYGLDCTYAKHPLGIQYDARGNLANDTGGDPAKGSFSVWIKTNFAYDADANKHWVMGKEVDTEVAGDMRLYYDGSDDKFHFAIYNGADWTTCESLSAAQTFSADDVIHVACTWDETIGTSLFIDNVKTSDSSTWTAIDLAGDLVIGNDPVTPSATEEADVIVAEPVLFDYVLTDEEFYDIYTSTKFIGDMDFGKRVEILNRTNKGMLFNYSGVQSAGHRIGSFAGNLYKNTRPLGTAITETAVTFNGTWTDAGNYRHTVDKNAYATLSFTGTELWACFYAGNSNGIAEYIIDEGTSKEKRTTIDQYYSSNDNRYALIASGLEDVSHTIKVKMKNLKTLNSTGKRICIGILTNADTMFYYNDGNETDFIKAGLSGALTIETSALGSEIIYDSVNSRYYVMGNSGNDAVFWYSSSNDLSSATWTKKTIDSSASYQACFDMIYDSTNSIYYVVGYATSANNDAIVWYSSSNDLTTATWTLKYIDGNVNNQQAYGICYDTANSRYYATGVHWNGTDYDAVVWYSSSNNLTTATWTKKNIDVNVNNQYAYRIIYDTVNTIYYVTGQHYNGTDNDAVIWYSSSNDLTTATWTRKNVAAGANSQTCQGIIYDSVNTRYYTVGSNHNGVDYNSVIWYSSSNNLTTATWTKIDINTSSGNQYAYGICYDSTNSRYYITTDIGSNALFTYMQLTSIPSGSFTVNNRLIDNILKIEYDTIPKAITFVDKGNISEYDHEGTIECVVKTPWAGNDSTQHIIINTVDSSGNNGFHFKKNDGNQLQFEFYGAAGYMGNISSAALTAVNWPANTEHHLLIKWWRPTSSTLGATIYLNGVKFVENKSQAIILTSHSQLLIGNYRVPASNTDFDGLILDLAIHNHAFNDGGVAVSASAAVGSEVYNSYIGLCRKYKEDASDQVGSGTTTTFFLSRGLVLNESDAIAYDDGNTATISSIKEGTYCRTNGAIDASDTTIVVDSFTRAESEIDTNGGYLWIGQANSLWRKKIEYSAYDDGTNTFTIANSGTVGEDFADNTIIEVCGTVTLSAAPAEASVVEITYYFSGDSIDREYGLVPDRLNKNLFLDVSGSATTGWQLSNNTAHSGTQKISTNVKGQISLLNINMANPSVSLEKDSNCGTIQLICNQGTVDEKSILLDNYNSSSVYQSIRYINEGLVGQSILRLVNGVDKNASSTNYYGELGANLLSSQHDLTGNALLANDINTVFDFSAIRVVNGQLDYDLDKSGNLLLAEDLTADETDIDIDTDTAADLDRLGRPCGIIKVGSEFIRYEDIDFTSSTTATLLNCKRGYLAELTGGSATTHTNNDAVQLVGAWRNNVVGRASSWFVKSGTFPYRALLVGCGTEGDVEGGLVIRDLDNNSNWMILEANDTNAIRGAVKCIGAHTGKILAGYGTLVKGMSDLDFISDEILGHGTNVGYGSVAGTKGTIAQVNDELGWSYTTHIGVALNSSYVNDIAMNFDATNYDIWVATGKSGTTGTSAGINRIYDGGDGILDTEYDLDADTSYWTTKLCYDVANDDLYVSQTDGVADHEILSKIGTPKITGDSTIDVADGTDRLTAQAICNDIAVEGSNVWFATDDGAKEVVKASFSSGITDTLDSSDFIELDIDICKTLNYDPDNAKLLLGFQNGSDGLLIECDVDGANPVYYDKTSETDVDRNNVLSNDLITAVSYLYWDIRDLGDQYTTLGDNGWVVATNLGITIKSSEGLTFTTYVDVEVTKDVNDVYTLTVVGVGPRREVLVEKDVNDVYTRTLDEDPNTAPMIDKIITKDVNDVYTSSDPS